MKAIIYLPLTNSCRVPPQGRFTRCVEHDKHLWDGKEYDLDDERDIAEFNATLDKALAAYPDRPVRPTIRIVAGRHKPLVSHLQVPLTPKPRTTKRKSDFVHATS